jgi:hypothetical protein
MRTYFLLATLFWMATAAAAPARDIFVDNINGDDRRGGTLAVSQGESGGPCHSIAKALRIAKASDRIIIANTGQPYRESVSIQGGRHNGTGDFPFVIVGNGATLDGRVSLGDAEWEYVAANVFRTRPPDELSAGFPGRRGGRSQHLRTAGSQAGTFGVVPAGGWIYFRVEQGKLPWSYELSCCACRHHAVRRA